MRVVKYALAALGPTVLLAVWRVATSKLLVVFHMEDFPGGEVTIAENRKVLPAGGRMAIAIFTIDRESDLRLACPSAPGSIEDRGGYFAPRLDFVVSVSIRVCAIPHIEYVL